MSEWREYLVEDIAAEHKHAMSTGPFGSAISSKFFVDDGVPVIRGGNLSPDVGVRIKDEGLVFVTEEKASEFERSVVEYGDIVFTCWGTINQIGMIDESARHKRYVISNKQMKLSVNPEAADHRFIYYLFSSPDKQSEILNNGIGAAVPGFNLGQLKKMPLSLPSISEQKAIVSVLASLDDKIDLLHRQNKTLEAMAETLFRQWFVEEASDEWEEVCLADFVAMNESTVTSSYPHAEIEYLDTGSLTDGIFGACQTLPLTDAPSRAKRLVSHNDILISTVRPDQRHYGIVKEPIDNLVVSTGFCVISCKRIDPHFVFLLLTNDEMTGYLHSIAEGSTSTYPSLKPTDIGAVTFQLAPQELLDNFASIAKSNWDKIEKNMNQIRTLEKLRDNLLPKLMSGEVRVV